MEMQYFELNDNETAALEYLRRVYNVDTLAGALRHAIAVASIASTQADDEYNIHLVRPDGCDVTLPQRF
jgi:hypothetical protein